MSTTKTHIPKAPAPTPTCGGPSEWRELDRRDFEGIRTILEWCADTGEIWVRCEQLENHEPLLCCQVAAADAGRAFRHPFAYAYAKLVSPIDAPALGEDEWGWPSGHSQQRADEPPESRWSRAVRRLWAALIGSSRTGWSESPIEWIP